MGLYSVLLAYAVEFISHLSCVFACARTHTYRACALVRARILCQYTGILYHYARDFAIGLPAKIDILIQNARFLPMQRKTPRKFEVFGAENRGRTDTMFPSRDFKSLASAYSAIPACVFSCSHLPSARRSLRRRRDDYGSSVCLFRHSGLYIRVILHFVQ